MPSDLLPCPFCGSEGEEKWSKDSRPIHWIECSNCGAKGPWGYVPHGGSGTDEWNKRAATYEAERDGNKRLREGYQECLEDMVDWASYAGDYFREKHDLAGDIVKHQTNLSVCGTGGSDE